MGLYEEARPILIINRELSDVINYFLNNGFKIFRMLFTKMGNIVYALQHDQIKLTTNSKAVDNETVLFSVPKIRELHWEIYYLHVSLKLVSFLKHQDVSLKIYYTMVSTLEWPIYVKEKVVDLDIIRDRSEILLLCAN